LLYIILKLLINPPKIQ